MKYMLDTNICIYIIKKKPTKVIERLKRLDVGDICISAITLAELCYGIEKSQNKERNRLALAAFLAPIEILPFSDEAAARYGEIRAFLEKTGQIIGAYDLLIAAHAISKNLILVTNNVSEFGRIPCLSIENWTE